MDIYQACVQTGPSRCPIYEENASLIKARVDRDPSDAVVDSLDLHRVLNHLCDWKLWE